jgi:hypothetical protein
MNVWNSRKLDVSLFRFYKYPISGPQGDLYEEVY